LECKLSSGPAHNTLTLWPRWGPLAAWSFAAPCLPSFDLNDRPVYTIVQSSATFKEQFDTLYFWITLEVSINVIVIFIYL
jgi:hypothetical protein